MENLVSTAIFSFLGLAIGNYLFQLLKSPPQWDVAFERSYFQGVAILALVVALQLH